MGRKVKDLTGKRFERLVVIGDTGNRAKSGGAIIWKCKCDCGNYKEVLTGNLNTGLTRSCGCLQREVLHERLINQGVNENSKSGIKGVYFEGRSEKWISAITVNRKRIYLGRFVEKDDAIKARKLAEEKYLK
ncbi:AP2 domain-containing protein [Bacillus paramycoides]|uniref:AP2 domain-containing protein n=1 Tax=Bacillus paramycoides TaxID=2026194 RepID=UPI002E247852|nr:AP2 domain-containing protein [Bacillus paramycoides]